MIKVQTFFKERKGVEIIKSLKTNSIDITITEVPKFSSIQNISRTTPNRLTDEQLLIQYSKLVAAKSAHTRNLLPDEWYRGIMDAGGVTGRVPKDAWLFQNINTSIEEYKIEIENRKLQDNFTLWVELLDDSHEFCRNL